MARHERKVTMWGRIVRWWAHVRCDILDWHQPSGGVGFDGCSATSRCKRCGRRVLMDSQGNWFSVKHQDD